MKIAVIGAGAIGSVVAGLLLQEEHEVTLVGRREQVDAINAHGLVIEGIPGGKRYGLPAKVALDFAPDIMLLAVKSQDVLEACKAVAPHAGSAVTVTMQNGVRSDEVAGMVLGRGRIVSSVVMFGATYLGPGRVEYNFPGGLLIGRAFPEEESKDGIVAAVKDALDKSFDVRVSEDIHGAHWTKLILNLNNSISGVMGRTLQEVFSDPELCRLGVMMMREAYGAMRCAGVALADLPDLPIAKLAGLLEAPVEVSAEVYGSIMKSLSGDPLPGSVLQSIRRGRPTEIDYLNGEIVMLGSTHGCPTPLNEAVTLLVKEVEKSGRFLGGDAVLKRLIG